MSTPPPVRPYRTLERRHVLGLVTLLSEIQAEAAKRLRDAEESLAWLHAELAHRDLETGSTPVRAEDATIKEGPTMT